MKPLAIDLCCGLFGWGKGFIAEGYHVIGVDIVQVGPVPAGAELILHDIRTLHGSQFPGATVIVASPPCLEFSRHDQPWLRAKNPPYPTLGIELVDACFRIARECGCSIVLENVRGAQQFIGQARAHFGKQYLWGDVPALLPAISGLQNDGRQKQSFSSSARAERAEIPFELAQWIARCFKPERQEQNVTSLPPRFEQGEVVNIPKGLTGAA
jgi:hypothetical protein